MQRSDWHPARFKHPDVQNIFQSRKWYCCKILGDGNCSLNALATALRLPKEQKTCNILRANLTTNPEFEKVSPQVLQKKLIENAWLAVDDLTFLAMEKFNVVPIIINDREQTDEESDPRFVFDVPKPFITSMTKIQEKASIAGKEVRYILIRYNGVHFETYGAKCKSILGEPDAAVLYRTIFKESQLPPDLITAWKQDLKAFVVSKAKETKRAAKQKPRENREVEIIE